MKTLLFIPGFLKTRKDLCWAHETNRKLNEHFNLLGWKVKMSNCYSNEPSRKHISAYGLKVAKEVIDLNPEPSRAGFKETGHRQVAGFFLMDFCFGQFDL